MQQYLFSVACILSTGIWMAVGLYKVTHQKKMVEVIRSHNIPYPHAAFWLSVVVELGGAVLLALQIYIWFVVAAWLVFLVVATPIFHGAIFRNGTIDYPQLVQTAKNVSIAGGLIALLVVEGTVPRLLSWNETGIRLTHETSPELRWIASRP